MRFLIRKDSVTHMAYHHLTLHELVMVETYWSMRVPVSRIAQRMRRGRQTIYRVIHAFDRGMTALEYYHEYKKHRYHCGRKRVRLRAQYVHLITCFLHQGLSFDVISGLFPRMLPCSSRTLYRLAHTGVFPKQSLPWKGKRHKNGVKDKRGGRYTFRRTLIDQAHAYPRFDTEFGHCEGYTIIGANHHSCVLTLAERQTKAIIALHTNGCTAKDIEDTLDAWLSSLPKNFVKSITFDCGKEFANWKTIANTHDIDIFFADPGCPGQRGLNENSNGLLRRDGLSKGMDSTTISQEQLNRVTRFRNNIPRKSLNYKTPIQVMTQHIREMSHLK